MAGQNFSREAYPMKLTIDDAQKEANKLIHSLTGLNS